MHPDTYIIIPVYNEAAVIESVVHKVSKEFQHIVCVNDGSRDSTAEAIAKLQQSWSIIRLT